MSGFYIYLHCKPDGTPFYVGKGTKRRANNMSNRTDWHKRIVAKHGVKVVMFPMASEQEAFDNEIVWIAALRSSGFALCNLTDGGEGVSGHAHSAETRAKLSASHKGKPSHNRGKAHSEESRKNMSVAHIGATVTEATKLKIKIASTGRKHSEDTKAKLRAMNVGRKHSPEAITKIKDARSVQIITPQSIEKMRIANLGKKLSEEHKAKIGAANKGAKKCQ